MKKTAYCLWVFFALLFVAGSCKKSDDVQPLPVVGAWTLDRIILTELPSPYDQLNSQNLDPLQFFAFQAVLTLKSDKTFTEKVTQGGVITDLSGTWDYTGTTLSVKYSDSSMDSFQYDDSKKQLQSVPTSSTITLVNPNTQASENVTAKFQMVYAKN